MTREDLYKALVKARDGITGKPLFSEPEAKDIVFGMSDEHVGHLSKTYESADEWVDYYTM